MKVRQARTAVERRVRRELRTVRAMIGLHCRDRHGCGSGLCDRCGALWEYARQRVERCPFRDDKPTCLRCTVHCFRPEMREAIRAAMRYAGPRMPWRHPVLALLHLLEERSGPRSPAR